MTRTGTGWALAISTGVWLAAGCGSSTPPTRAQTDAVAAVRSAEALDAASTPVAAYQLELARGELQQADTLVRQGRMQQAQDVLERAKADAELAMALRREAQAREAAAEAHQHIEQLRQDDIGTSGGAAPITTSGTTSETPETQTTVTTTTTTTAE